nr:MAG TPA: hypothetical protein [Caudoviricetes sp.]
MTIYFLLRKLYIIYRKRSKLWNIQTNLHHV